MTFSGRIAPWGWGGTWQEFTQLDRATLLNSLIAHHRARLAELPIGNDQVRAWEAAFPPLQRTIQALVEEYPDLAGSLITFEYELPGEAGRRPDVVLVLPNGHLIVIECKNRGAGAVLTADLDQVTAYARDLSEYHSASHALATHKLLLLTGSAPTILAPNTHGVFISWPVQGRVAALEGLVSSLFKLPVVDIEPLNWLHGEYQPLPALVRAAIETFRRNPLPAIKSVRSTRIPHILTWLQEITAAARRDKHHALVLLTGVPGSGKTLVGLQSVVDAADNDVRALYLTGNGPLTGVLQDALDRLSDARPARSLIRGMMEVKKYATRSERHAPAEFYVFDEAQRAWNQVADYSGSEIQLLVDVASRRDWVYCWL